MDAPLRRLFHYASKIPLMYNAGTRIGDSSSIWQKVGTIHSVEAIADASEIVSPGQRGSFSPHAHSMPVITASWICAFIGLLSQMMVQSTDVFEEPSCLMARHLFSRRTGSPWSGHSFVVFFFFQINKGGIAVVNPWPRFAFLTLILPSPYSRHLRNSCLNGES